MFLKQTIKLVFFIFVLGYAMSSKAQTLIVQKIEPPNWWIGMKWNRIQLMLYGQNLGGISVQFSDKNLKVTAVHTKPSSSYAFVEVEIPDDLSAGRYTVEITQGNKYSILDYPILEREKGSQRNQGFSVDDVIYLITPDRFANGNTTNDQVEGILDDFDSLDHSKRHGGDLQGIIDHLPYLQDLGVTTIWLNPILENNGINSYHGYAATDLYRVDPRLGTNADYKRLVEKAHCNGLKIIFDHISNHIGIRHPWLKDLPTDTWLNGSTEDHLSDKHYLLSITDPHADPYTEELLHTFWFVDSMPDLNQRDPFLADYLIQNVLWWIEYSGIDGIREDTYPYADQAFLARWAESILHEYPNFNIVGEIWATEPAYIAMFQKNSQLAPTFETNLPCLMDFPLSQALRHYLEGTGKLQDIYRIFAQDFLYTDVDNLLTFFDNHDMARGIFIADKNMRKIQQVLIMLLTTRGIPQILYGTEINMIGGESHIELRADFPGGFPGHNRDAFTETGRTNEENEIFHYLRDLLHLRKTHKALTHGKMIHYPPSFQADVYKYLRIYVDEKVLVMV
ncbi:TPA: alpha-amlyase, partial [Candidatus Poribacteria bacterium]|nr:alpha-amlyase [Candidatus Poribacteria bacterium]